MRHIFETMKFGRFGRFCMALCSCDKRRDQSVQGVIAKYRELAGRTDFPWAKRWGKAGIQVPISEATVRAARSVLSQPSISRSLIHNFNKLQASFWSRADCCLPVRARAAWFSEAAFRSCPAARRWMLDRILCPLPKPYRNVVVENASWKQTGEALWMINEPRKTTYVSFKFNKVRSSHERSI